MKRINTYLRAFSALILLLSASVESVAHADEKKVLMVVSGFGVKQGEAAPGYEFDEFAKAYLVFKANGVVVDIASPKGGAVEADDYDAAKPYNQKVLNDPAIMAKLSNTLSTAYVKANQYDGIFIVGGKGAMFDLPKDLALQKLIADIYQNQGTVAAVCHGPAALVDVKLDDGSYLLANKVVNGFTNEEERLFGKKWMSTFAFLLEDKLIERGGKFQSSDIMLNHVAVDKGLITGQNPTSTSAVATELVKTLGINPIKIEAYRDDKTLALVEKLLAGDGEAAKTLRADPVMYHIELVGMYGYYYLNTADSEKELHNALTLMKIGQTKLNNPNLYMRIAQTQKKLGDNVAASATLEKLLVSKPDFKPAIDMLSTLSL